MRLPTRILVTGSSGFIGRHLVRVLGDSGVDVVADTYPSGDYIDITERQGIFDLFERCTPDAVVHLAGVSGPMVSRRDPLSIIDVNISGTANLLEAARLHGTARFVFASSNAVYGNNTDLLDELTTPCRPSTVYGATKVAGEQLLAAYARSYGLVGLALRISAVYGPGRTTHCIIGEFIKDALQDRPSQAQFGADFVRQYVYVDDAVRAIVGALGVDPGVDCPPVNVSGDVAGSAGEIADIVRALLPRARIEFGIGPDPEDSDLQGPFALTRAREVLGFRPRVSLPVGIARYIEHLKR